MKEKNGGFLRPAIDESFRSFTKVRENAENVLVFVLFFENQKWVVVTRE